MSPKRMPEALEAVPRRELGVLVAVSLATALAPLNSTMLIVALPDVIDDFEVTLSSAGWLITGYLIAVAALQTPAGKLGDRLGHRRLFLGGLAAFLLVSLGAAAAPALAPLIACRIGQGIAGAVVFPNGWAILRDVIPAERRASRFGYVGAGISLAAATGPQIGDLALRFGGWRVVFVVNIAFVLPAYVIGRRSLPRTPERTTARAAFDLAGTLTWLTLLGSAAALLNWTARSGRFGALLVGVPALAAAGTWFIRRELAHPDPVLQPRFFRRPAFAAANVAIAFSNLSMYVTLLAVPLMLEGRKLSAGLILTIMTGLAVALSPVGGRLADRFGRRKPAVAGLSLMAAGVFPLALFADGIAIPLLVACLAMSGAGLGLSAAAMQTAALESMEAHEAGVASGVYATSRYLGSIFGSTLLAASAHPAGRGTFIMVVGAAVVAVLAVTRLPKGSRSAGFYPAERRR